MGEPKRNLFEYSENEKSGERRDKFVIRDTPPDSDRLCLKQSGADSLMPFGWEEGPEDEDYLGDSEIF